MKTVPPPLVVAAETEDEGPAFLSCVFRQPELAEAADRVLVFNKREAFERLSSGRDLFVAVTHSQDVEAATAAFQSTIRCIHVVARRSWEGRIRPDIDCGMVSAQAFADGLRLMGKTPDAIEQLTQKTGGSLTVLRRILSVKNPAVRQPSWSNQSDEVLRVLTAAAFLGSWTISRQATPSDDEALLSFLTGFSAETVEDHWKTLCRIPDTPVWEAWDCRGVVSKYDIFFALSHTVTRFLWNRFQQVVQKVLPPVLSEKNAESVNGVSTGRYSSIVRRGVLETVVFLAAQGKTLFKDLPGADEASWVQWVQRRLMPITAKRLETDSRYLAFYAEIAPTTFLSFLESDLNQSDSEVMKLMRSTKTSWATPCPWTGLLNALECLAWEPLTFRRSVEVLARLAAAEPPDNDWKGPLQSLSNIFRCWMPQTLVAADGRLRELQRLLERFPTVGWQLLQQYVAEDCVGDFSYKPRWRRGSMDYGDVQAVSHEEIQAAVNLLLSRPHYEVNQLTDLVEHLKDLIPVDREKVFQLIRCWQETEGTDEAAERVRSALRRWGPRDTSERSVGGAGAL